jgi:hypothetical protein
MYRPLLHASSLALALAAGAAEFIALQRCRLQDWLLQHAR